MANNPRDPTTQPPPLPTRPHGIESPPLAAPPVVVDFPVSLSVAPPLHQHFGDFAAERIMDLDRPVSQHRSDAPAFRTVYQLAAGIMLFAVLQLAPLWNHGNLTTAPTWTRWIAMLALLQFAFAAWMALLPDKSTIRSTTFILAAIATLYGVALGIALIPSPSNPLLPEITEIRDRARFWCGSIMLLACGMTYLTGRVSFRRGSACAIVA
jgi:hypothetical protein